MIPIATGFNQRDTTLIDVLNSLLDRIQKLENPQSFHIGPIGGNLSASQGYMVSVDPSNGNLIATSDSGTSVTILATP